MTRILTVAVTAVAAALALALPAVAATPTYKGTVGPGFTIKLASKPTKAGKIKLVVSDKSSQHNFHLSGPGVNVKTSVGQSILETMKSPEELQVMFELLEQLGKQDIDRFVPGSGMSSADASG